MSQTDPFTYVQRSFPPTVGCLSSSTVEQICQKNNLSFVEILRPFCSLNVDHRLRDPSGNDHLVKKLQICIQDVNDRPPQPSLAKKFLNESVINVSCDNTKPLTFGSLTVDVPVECPWFQSWSNTFLQVQFPSDHEFTKHLLGCLLVSSSTDPPETPQMLLQSLQQMQAIAPARLPKWFSTSIFKFYVLIHDSKEGDKAKAMNFFNSLKTAYGPDHCFFLEINSHTQDANTVLPDYWANYIFRKNIDLDGSDHGSSPRTPAEMGGIGGMPNSVATETEVSLKSSEVSAGGGETPVPVVIHPLSPEIEVTQFNSLIAEQSVPHETLKVVNANVWNNMHSNFQLGSCLSPADIENIKALIKHLVFQALIPHIEKQIFHLNDMASNKKGMSRSLLSATKRLFGTTKPGSPSSVPLNSVIYAFDAPELHHRRLGDLYFMFTNYSAAFQAYHSAKRDFGADQAWMYYAGALEMAALSAFMQGEVTKKGLDYMEEAILTYLNSCKLPQFATRATLLSTQFLKERHLYGEAAKQLIRMTSEDSDLRSALLLEQAAYCFLFATKPNMLRKYAFHMVLAGHRFSKGGQKKHALRCYKQAFQVYKNRGWSLAEDHIHFKIGRLAGQLKLLSEGSSSLASLLSSGSKQTPAQQEDYLKEYLQMLQQANAEEPGKSLSLLPLPIIEDNSISVLVSSSTSSLIRAFEPDSPADSVRWSRMEELAVTESSGAPMIFRPTIHLFSKSTLNTTHPVAVINEPIYIQVLLRNPLQIVLPLLRVRLLWSFTSADGQVTCNEFPTTVSESLVNTNLLECIRLEPSSTQKVTLSFVPLCPGQIQILGVSYSLTYASSASVQKVDSADVQGKQLFVVRGPKLRSKKEGGAVAFEKDKRLEINIIKSAPLVKVEIETDIKPDMFCGEIQEARVKLVNCGNSSLKNLFMVTNSPGLISLLNSNIDSDKVINEPFDNDGEYEQDKNHLYRVVKIHLGENAMLKAQEELILPLWIRAPTHKGPARVNILFYYENSEANSTLGHRVSRCSFEMTVHRSLQLTATVSRSTLCEDRDTMNINVTVQNLNHSNDPIVTIISLAQMSLASATWKLQEKAIFSTEMRLRSQERYYFLIKADRISGDELLVSDVSFVGKVEVPGSDQPFFDFYKWDVYEEKKDGSTHLFSLPLYLRWNAKIIDSNNESRSVFGQSLVVLNQLGVAKVWPAGPRNELQTTGGGQTFKIFGPERKYLLSDKGRKSVRLENALSYNLVHENTVSHSFEENRICRVEMKLILRNCIDSPVKVVVNSSDSKFVSKTQLYTPHSSSAFNWTSRSNVLLRLDAHDHAKVLLSAVFTAPGTYDLGSRLTVAVAAEGDTDYVTQVARPDLILSQIRSDLRLLGGKDSTFQDPKLKETSCGKRTDGDHGPLSSMADRNPLTGNRPMPAPSRGKEHKRRKRESMGLSF